MSFPDTCKALNLRKSIWRQEDLPGLHLAYEEKEIHAIFYGMKVFLESDMNDILSSVYMQSMKQICDSFINHSYGSLSDAILMSDKISKKVERLPQTKIWISLNS